MASSMITGERRWAASRRGGMTVLGKVAVPKPINLPSQRLENHGLDPNVEIVPKGTLSWGSRPSSAGSNAWGSSVLSPRTEGSSVSPSHRPSSSGGTRPSTAGSVKGHDSVTNAWGANSRPSSASGALTTNHTAVTSSRPRSAETRPGSSQLSRFAESVPDSSGPWGAAGAAEKLGVTSSTKDAFSLRSGDFPTLGSEKDNSGKSTTSLDHAAHDHPGSSSGRLSSVTERTETATSDDASRNINVKGGIINSWRKDGPHEDVSQLGTERWHGDPHPCPNPKMPHHYESWHGASGVNPPGGIWFGGPPAAPYGAPIAPGGFPMEPFPYYRPPVSAPGLPNSQAVPLSVSGHHGHHPKNGDLYRPHMPDSYIRPAIPIRPGFFPGPVAYEGLYGPPMGFCNPNDRDFPFMGMPPGHPVYNRYSNHNAADPGNSHARSSEGRSPDQVESGRPADSRGHSKFSTKQNNGWDQNDEEGMWGNKVTNNVYGCEKDLPQSSLQENAQIEGHRKDEEVIYRKRAPGEEASSQSFEDKVGSVFPANVKFSGSTAPAVTAVSNPVVESLDFPRDGTLMKKIESLNAKARASDGRHDLASGFHREEPRNRSQVVNTRANHPTTEANAGVVCPERQHPSGVLVPVSCDPCISMGDKNVEIAVGSVTNVSRRTMHGVHIRGDHRVKGRLNSPDSDGWRKKNAASESPNIVAGAASETISNVQVHEHPVFLQSSEMSKSNIDGKDDILLHALDPSDSQRAKMKEMAKQRAVQLQMEEEQRTREQKAKALAKLEELDRRSANQGKDTSSRKLEKVATHSAGHHKQEESENRPVSGLESDTSGVLMACGSSNITHASEYAVTSSCISAESGKSKSEDSVLSQNLTLPAAQGVCPDDTAGNKTATHARDFSKQKRVGYKQKQNVPLEKSFSDQSISISATDTAKDHNDGIANVSQKVVVDEIASACEVNHHVESPRAADSSGHHKKKSKSVKNKQKLEEPSSAVLTSQSEKESGVGKAITENVNLETPVSKLDPASGQSLAGSGDAILSSMNHSSLLHEDTHGRVNNSWKQHSKKMMRSVQTNRSADRSYSNDAVVWAPVRLQNKNEVIDDLSQKAPEASVPSAKNDHVVQNTSKSKRAEMERYVPKPAAKELAQQGSIQQSASPPVDQIAADGTNGRTKASGRIGIAAESKTVESKPRQTRSQGLWRPRVSSESTLAQVSDDGSSSTVDASNKAQTSFGQQQMLKLPEQSVKEQPFKPDEHLVQGNALKPDEGNGDDGWNTFEESISTSRATAPGVKDQGILGRGKQSSFKGHSVSGNNNAIDPKNANGGELDAQCLPADMIQMDRTTTWNDNRVSEDRSTSHRKPKFQSYGAHNQRGNRFRGGHNVNAEGSKASKGESSNNSGLHSLSQNEGNCMDVPQPLPAQSAFENNDASGTRNGGHKEARGETKAPLLRGHADSPSQGLVSEGDPASHGTMDGHIERHSSGHRRSVNYNSRFGGQETHGDRSSTIQDNRQHYAPANQERQWQNPHYEYQPVGPYNSNKSNNSEGQTDNLQMGPRFRERGQSHSRRGRGNFNGRQRGNAQINE